MITDYNSKENNEVLAFPSDKRKVDCYRGLTVIGRIYEKYYPQPKGEKRLVNYQTSEGECTIPCFCFYCTIEVTIVHSLLLLQNRVSPLHWFEVREWPPPSVWRILVHRTKIFTLGKAEILKEKRAFSINCCSKYTNVCFDFDRLLADMPPNGSNVKLVRGT